MASRAFILLLYGENRSKQPSGSLSRPSALESGYDPAARALVVFERYSGIQRAWTRPSTARHNMIHINGRRMRRLVWQIKLVAAGGIFLLNVDEPCLCPGIKLQQSRCCLRRKRRCLRFRRSA